jgi:asparagine synthase (glutamine-hydrolysing)
MQALQHRGPDDAGEYCSGPVAMGFRRLSIIDLSPGGHQPMTTDDGHLTLVFNGEIYNYRELRRELTLLGQHFRSSSDTEVLLAAYREWGRECVHRFNGMFAFVIYDRRTGTFFGARDRLGVKPLYFWQDKAWIVLASEPRAVGATGLIELEPDWVRVRQGMIAGRMDHEGGTCFVGIRQVPAAHGVTVDATDGLQHSAYWRLPEEAAQPSEANGRSDAEWVSELGALVSDAVTMRLRSDVPLGFTLSGGIDSSLLICEAAQQGQRDLMAFSYQDRDYDERQPIADTVAQTGARLHTIQDSQLDVAALLPKVIWANGEPVHSLAPVANYALFGLAREQGVKVLLGGQGADEVFGGYRDFQRDYWHSLFVDLKWQQLTADVQASARLHGHGVARVLLDTAQRAVRFALSSTAAYQGLRALRAAVVDRGSRGLFSPEWAGPPPPLPRQPYRLHGILCHAVAEWPLPLYLRIEDRISMSHSVEARLPFTDYRIVDHALRMPDRLRFAQGMNKLALRRVAAARVPASVSGRVNKFGFPVGSGESVVKGLHNLCKELTLNRAFRERGIYDGVVVQQLLTRSPRVQDTDMLFELAQMELWLMGLQHQHQKASG